MAATLLVTGTDTDVGKTYVACRLIERLRSEGVCVAAFKPAASGAVDGRWGDVDALRAASGRTDVCPQTFAAPLAPPDAARAEGRKVDAAAIDAGLAAAGEDASHLVVEGVGGLLCPLTDAETVADWAVRHRLPLLVVVSLKLGAISHTLLTAEVAETRGLPAAFVLNEAAPCDTLTRQSTVRSIADRLGDRIVARVQPGGGLLRFGAADPTMNSPEPASIDRLLCCFEPE